MLWIFLYLALRAAEAAEMINPDSFTSSFHGESHFSNVGTLVSPTTWYTARIDLHVEADLRTQTSMFHEAIDQLHEVLGRVEDADTMKDSLSADTVFTWLRDQKKLVKYIYEPSLEAYEDAKAELLDLVADDDPDERALAAIGAFLLGIAVDEVISNFLPDKELTQMHSQLAHTAHILKLHTQRMQEYIEADTAARSLDHHGDVVRVAAYNLAKRIDAGTTLVNQFIHAVYMAKNHRLYLPMVGKQMLEKINDQVVNFAFHNHLQTAVDLRHHIQRLPVSYLVNNGTVSLLLHIPMVNSIKDDVRTLHVLRSAIVQRPNASDFDGEDDGGDSNQNFLSLHTDTPYVATTEDLQKHSVHKPTDLEQCHKVEKTWYCSYEAVLLKTPQTCVAALFYQDHDTTTSLCSRQFRPTHTKVDQIGATTFYVEDDDDLQLVCKKSTKRLELPPNRTINVPHGCSVTSRNFQAAPATVAHPDYFIVNTTILYYQAQRNNTASRVNEMFSDISDSLNIRSGKSFVDQLAEVEQQAADNDQEIHDTAVQNSVGITGSAIILIASCGAVFICYLRKPSRHSLWRRLCCRMQDGPHRSQDREDPGLPEDQPCRGPACPGSTSTNGQRCQPRTSHGCHSCRPGHSTPQRREQSRTSSTTDKLFNGSDLQIVVTQADEQQVQHAAAITQAEAQALEQLQAAVLQTTQEELRKGTLAPTDRDVVDATNQRLNRLLTQRDEANPAAHQGVSDNSLASGASTSNRSRI